MEAATRGISAILNATAQIITDEVVEETGTTPP
jgi:hypothetical protein